MSERDQQRLEDDWHTWNGIFQSRREKLSELIRETSAPWEDPTKRQAILDARLRAVPQSREALRGDRAAPRPYL